MTDTPKDTSQPSVLYYLEQKSYGRGGVRPRLLPGTFGLAGDGGGTTKDTTPLSPVFLDELANAQPMISVGVDGNVGAKKLSEPTPR